MKYEDFLDRYFFKICFDAGFTDLEQFEQDLKSIIDLAVDKKMEWHKKNYAEMLELCNKALEVK